MNFLNKICSPEFQKLLSMSAFKISTVAWFHEVGVLFSQHIKTSITSERPPESPIKSSRWSEVLFKSRSLQQFTPRTQWSHSATVLSCYSSPPVRTLSCSIRSGDTTYSRDLRITALAPRPWRSSWTTRMTLRSTRSRSLRLPPPRTQNNLSYK
jgi:hypothetical protein